MTDTTSTTWEGEVEFRVWGDKARQFVAPVRLAEYGNGWGGSIMLDDADALATLEGERISLVFPSGLLGMVDVVDAGGTFVGLGLTPWVPLSGRTTTVSPLTR